MSLILSRTFRPAASPIIQPLVLIAFGMQPLLSTSTTIAHPRMEPWVNRRFHAPTLPTIGLTLALLGITHRGNATAIPRQDYCHEDPTHNPLADPVGGDKLGADQAVTLSPKQRAEVFAMFDGHCAYCGIILPARWHADHIEPVMREWWKAHRSPTVSKWDGDKFIQIAQDRRVTASRPEHDHIHNMFPACAPCNIDKGALPLEEWRDWLNQRIIEGLRRNSSTFRHAERFGRVTIATDPLVFYFEKFADLKKK